MKRVLNFLRESQVFYIATVEDNKPKLRPFNAVTAFENRLYIQTAKDKEIYQQLLANPYIEICTAEPSGSWIRLSAEAYEDTRREARLHMIKTVPMLKKMYSADDGRMTVFYLKNIDAIIYHRHRAPKVILCDAVPDPPQEA